MTEYRVETDTLGNVNVPKEAYWGAQTQRALNNFAIGNELMPIEVIYAYTELKLACAHANHEQAKLTDAQYEAIEAACHAILSGELDDQFPISLWQTGSGTQTNMNVNEVITNYANKSLGLSRGEEGSLHPNDDINNQQSSNDTFPCAMHITLCKALILDLLPTLVNLKACLEDKINSFEGIIRIGRTHLQDAVPLTLSQSFSAYHQFVSEAIQNLHNSLDGLYELPIGGTAVGTGVNCEEGFSEIVINHLSQASSIPYTLAKNNFSQLSSHNALTVMSGHLSTLATNLNKIANDIRLLGSGPRCGLGELILPSNEPGSSIMPGKVNPTQCESLSMIALQVIANHQTISMANASGHFELNTYKPLMIYAILQSCQLINDGCKSFQTHLLEGLSANKAQIEKHLSESLMLITALKPIIGYDNCARIAKYAYENNQTLREAAIELKLVDANVFDEHVKPEAML